MSRPPSSPWRAIALAVAALLAAWVAAAWLSHPGFTPRDGGEPELRGPVLVPGPLAVLQDLYDLLAHERFVFDILQSLKRVLLGVLAAAVPAFVLGVWLGTSAGARSTASPLFAFVQYIPPTAFVPILILWLGVGLQQQVALLFLGTFFYLTMLVAETVAGTPAAYKEAALTLGLRPGQLVWGVLVPYGLPEFLAHLRLTFGVAWTYLTVAEMVAAEDGIGRVIINSQRYLQTGRVLAGMLTIGLLGVATDLLLRQASRQLCPWKE